MHPHIILQIATILLYLSLFSFSFYDCRDRDDNAQFGSWLGTDYTGRAIIAAGAHGDAQMLYVKIRV